MTKKPLCRIVPLTYQPKIPGVQAGTINQTFRIRKKEKGPVKLKEGDYISFHGWEGIPYRSPWSWRTPYCKIVMAFPILVRNAGIYFDKEKKCIGIGDQKLDLLAERDGIQPAKGEELIRVLHDLYGPGPLQGKIIRWDPEPILKKRPYCFAFPHLVLSEGLDDPNDKCGSTCDHFEDCQRCYDVVQGVQEPIPFEEPAYLESPIPHLVQVPGIVKEAKQIGLFDYVQIGDISGRRIHD
jgi:hypothetical protein